VETIDLRDRAEDRRQVGHDRVVDQLRGQRLRQQERTGDVGAQRVVHLRRRHVREGLARMQHAGIVDQHVKPMLVRAVDHQRQFTRQFRMRFGVGHVQRQHVQAAGVLAGQLVERVGAAGVAAGGDDVVAARQQLADELQADAAVGTGDQHTARSGGGAHRDLLGDGVDDAGVTV
jgi:hypothetical protein